MSAELKTAEAAQEILAREIYVANQLAYNPDVPASEHRGQWYLALTDDNRSAWREQATQVVTSLGESSLEIAWAAESATDTAPPT